MYWLLLVGHHSTLFGHWDSACEHGIQRTTETIESI